MRKIPPFLAQNLNFHHFLCLFTSGVVCRLVFVSHEYFARKVNATSTVVMKQLHYKCDETVNFCSFRCATKSPITVFINVVFSERELKFMFAICHRPSVRRLSVTFVHPTQAIKIFGNVSTPFGILDIRDLSVRILRRSSQGNPSVGGVKHKRGSRI